MSRYPQYTPDNNPNYKNGDWVSRKWPVYQWYWCPCFPYPISISQAMLRVTCALTGHVKAADGSWCFGASVCGNCGMYYNEWSREKLKSAADAINKLPSDKQQSAAAVMSGGRPYE